jgi:uroporphyrinogen-III synthase
MERRGKTIAITRPLAQSESLRSGLELHGFEVVECPAIEIVSTEDWTALDAAIDSLATFDWLLLTSANASDIFFRRLSQRNAQCQIPIVAVGEATAEHAAQWGPHDVLRPADEFRAEGLLKVFPADLRGKRVLFPRAEAARETLPRELRRRGADVEMVPVYSTRKCEPGIALLRDRLESHAIDCVVFTSPSAVRFVALEFGARLEPLLAGVSIASIGPIVREAIQQSGLAVDIEPPRAKVADLVEAIATHFSSERWRTRNGD